MMRDIRYQLDDLYIMIQELSEQTILSFENALNLVRTIADRLIMIKATSPSTYFPLNEIIKSNMLGTVSSMMKNDLEVICSIRSGKTKKYVTKDYTIINGDFYRAHPPLCCTTETRVMTADEVQQMGQRNMEHRNAPYETCIYERRGSQGLETCSPFWDDPQFEGDESHLNIQYDFIGTDEFDIVPVKKYGWDIRCWYGCPSNEQREATPWP